MKQFILLLAAAVSAANLGDVSGDRMRAHVKYLASDQLEGRGVGTRGEKLATEYIAAQFASAGAKPAGENGTFFQHVPMVGAVTERSATLTAIANNQPVSFRWLDDYVGVSEPQEATDQFDAEAIFVGHGIVAPEFHWDDFKGVDVKGKVLVLFTNEPPSDDPKFFGGPALTYYGRWTYKYEQAARMGAAGVILIHKTEMASYGWDVVRNSWGGERAYLRDDPAPKLKLASWVQLDVARKLAQDRRADKRAPLP